MSDVSLTQDDDDGAENAVVEEAFLLYRDAGLRLPPVPRELAAELEQTGDWCFATGDVNPTDRDRFLAAAVDPATPSEVAFGHFGHGVASWHLCYCLLLPPLAVFVRQLFGAVTDDDDSANFQRVNDTAALLEELVVLADAARASGKLAAGQRFIVVLDDREGDFWQATPGGARNEGEHVLADAMSFLERGG